MSDVTLRPQQLHFMHFIEERHHTANIRHLLQSLGGDRSLLLPVDRFRLHFLSNKIHSSVYLRTTIILSQLHIFSYCVETSVGLVSGSPLWSYFSDSRADCLRNMLQNCPLTLLPTTDKCRFICR